MDKKNKLIVGKVIKNICDGVLPIKTEIHFTEPYSSQLSFSEICTLDDCTKQAKIYLNPDNDLFVNLDESKKYAITLGLAIHEMLHIWFTDFDELSRRYEDKKEQQKPLFLTIFNIFEDSRINNLVEEVFGGIAIESLQFTIQHIWKNSLPIDSYEEPLTQIINALVQYGDMGKIIGRFSKKQEDIDDEINAEEDFQYVAGLLDKVRNFQKCSDCLDLADQASDYLLRKYDYSEPLIPQKDNPSIKSGKNNDDKGSESKQKQQQNQETKSSMNSTSQDSENSLENKSESSASNIISSEEESNSSNGEESESKNSFISSPENTFNFDNLSKKIKELVDNAAHQVIVCRNIDKEIKEEERNTFEINDPEASLCQYTKMPITIRDIQNYGSFAINYDIYYRARALTSSLTSIFKSKRTGFKADTSGKINLNKYGNGKVTPYIFDKRIEKVNDAAVLILIDQSGSMKGENITEAAAMACEMGEAFNKLKIPFAIAGHNWTYKLEFNLYKPFEQKNWQSVAGMKAVGRNADGAAIRMGYKYLKYNAKSKHKVLIVITDGLSHDVENCKKAIQEAKKVATVIGISLMVSEADRKAISGMYGEYNHIVCKKMADLNPLLTKKLRQLAVNW